MDYVTFRVSRQFAIRRLVIEAIQRLENDVMVSVATAIDAYRQNDRQDDLEYFNDAIDQVRNLRNARAEIAGEPKPTTPVAEANARTGADADDVPW